MYIHYTQKAFLGSPSQQILKQDLKTILDVPQAYSLNISEPQFPQLSESD